MVLYFINYVEFKYHDIIISPHITCNIYQSGSSSESSSINSKQFLRKPKKVLKENDIIEIKQNINCCIGDSKPINSFLGVEAPEYGSPKHALKRGRCVEIEPESLNSPKDGSGADSELQKYPVESLVKISSEIISQDMGSIELGLNFNNKYLSSSNLSMNSRSSEDIKPEFLNSPMDGSGVVSELQKISSEIISKCTVDKTIGLYVSKSISSSSLSVSEIVQRNPKTLESYHQNIDNVPISPIDGSRVVSELQRISSEIIGEGTEDREIGLYGSKSISSSSFSVSEIVQPNPKTLESYHQNIDNVPISPMDVSGVVSELQRISSEIIGEGTEDKETGLDVSKSISSSSLSVSAIVQSSPKTLESYHQNIDNIPISLGPVGNDITYSVVNDSPNKEGWQIGSNLIDIDCKKLEYTNPGKPAKSKYKLS